MKKFILILAVLLFVLPCFAEEEYPDASEKLYVTAKLLNGRAQPSKKSTVEAFFDKGDTVIPTGRWSTNYEWVEICGGETGTVWCHIKYLSEIVEEKYYINPEIKSKVKIRRHPVNGKVVDYLKGGKKVKITRIVNGWGRCSKGWIDMDYLEEYDDE